MLIRISSILLGVLGVVALILGILFWTGNALNLVTVHILVGVLTVLLLLVVGIGQAVSKGGSWPMAILAVVLGAVSLWLGMAQLTMLLGSSHIVIQVIHLLLGLALVGVGQAMAGRYRRVMAA